MENQMNQLHGYEHVNEGGWVEKALDQLGLEQPKTDQSHNKNSSAIKPLCFDIDSIFSLSLRMFNHHKRNQIRIQALASLPKS